MDSFCADMGELFYSENVSDIFSNLGSVSNSLHMTHSNDLKVDSNPPKAIQLTEQRSSIVKVELELY